MALIPYKPNQGVYARGAAGAGLLVFDLMASLRLAQMAGLKEDVAAIGLPAGYLWGAGLFLALGALIGVIIFGVETGWEALDGKSRALVDLLIDTETELQKVSWPGREELRRSTLVVLLCILVLGVYLVVVDVAVSATMKSAGVLPRPETEQPAP